MNKENKSSKNNYIPRFLKKDSEYVKILLPKKAMAQTTSFAKCCIFNPLFPNVEKWPNIP